MINELDTPGFYHEILCYMIGGEKKERERESFMIFDLLLIVNDLLGNISTDVIYKYMNVWNWIVDELIEI